MKIVRVPGYGYLCCFQSFTMTNHTKKDNGHLCCFHIGASLSAGKACQVDLLGEIMPACSLNFDKFCRIAPPTGILGHMYTSQYKKPSSDFDQHSDYESFS